MGVQDWEPLEVMGVSRCCVGGLTVEEAVGEAPEEEQNSDWCMSVEFYMRHHHCDKPKALGIRDCFNVRLAAAVIVSSETMILRLYHAMAIAVPS